jgi:hypothetical protein
MSLVHYQGKYSDVNFNKVKYSADEQGLVFCNNYAKWKVNADDNADLLIDDTEEYINLYDLGKHLFISCLPNLGIYVYSPLCGVGVVYINETKRKLEFGINYGNKVPEGVSLVMFPLFFPFQKIYTNIAVILGNPVDVQIEVQDPLACATETWKLQKVKDGLYVAWKEA